MRIKPFIEIEHENQNDSKSSTDDNYQRIAKVKHVEIKPPTKRKSLFTKNKTKKDRNMRALKMLFLELVCHVTTRAILQPS